MIAVGKWMEPLEDRIESERAEGNSIYRYYEEERLKVYDPFSHQFVSNLLTEGKVAAWNKGGYFIISQTGSGKSTLVNEVISPLILSRRKKGLLITPRVALTMQYKRDIAKLYCPEKLEELQDKGIQREFEFGPLDIFTLQELTIEYKKNYVLEKRKNYDFLIIDEVHAFVGDACFNSFTEEILRLLVLQIGAETKRIYMTATPGIALKEIVDIENEVTGRNPSQFNRYGFPLDDVYLTVYRFQQDYSYVKPVFFEEESTIIKHLLEIPAGEKAIIFVKSKAQGARMQEKLGKDKAVYMDAENKLASEEKTFNEIIKENYFDKQFLVATRFLDVGVNLKDYRIKHVVIFHIYREEVIQMVGRKRIIEKETVNLYIRIPKPSEIEQEIRKLEDEYTEMKNNISKNLKGFKGVFSQLPMPLFVKAEKGGVHICYNRFSMAINDYHRKQLWKYMEDSQVGREFFEGFKEKILQWIPGHKTYGDLERPGNGNGSLLEDIKLLLDPLLGKELGREEMVGISEKLLDIFKISRRRSQKEQIAMNLIRKKFCEYSLPYTIKNMSKCNKTGIWIIERGLE